MRTLSYGSIVTAQQQATATAISPRGSHDKVLTFFKHHNDDFQSSFDRITSV